MDFDKIPENYRADIKKAADLLKREGCKAVFLFGSMVTGRIHQKSNINIGIMGLPPQKFIRTWVNLDDEVSSVVELVDFDSYMELYNHLDSLGEVVKIG
jgi:predicted nucleotidyltransferase